MGGKLFGSPLFVWGEVVWVTAALVVFEGGRVMTGTASEQLTRKEEGKIRKSVVFLDGSGGTLACRLSWEKMSGTEEVRG